jgi:lipopolysaccharide biosynthesis regulator YciM
LLNPIILDALKGHIPRGLLEPSSKEIIFSKTHTRGMAETPPKNSANDLAPSNEEKIMATMSHLCLHCGFEVHNNYSSGGECPKCGGCYWSSSSDEDYETEEERRG